uniref:Transferrin-like domain-containing protein n=1 Tax=Balaenoptera musculus TaxID=9771 RepID=A0A8C0HTA5_BALMU
LILMPQQLLPWLCLAVPEKTVRWCTVSNHEANKCYSFHDNMNNVPPGPGPFPHRRGPKHGRQGGLDLGASQPGPGEFWKRQVSRIPALWLSSWKGPAVYGRRPWVFKSPT